jgi:hypothetical protein
MKRFLPVVFLLAFASGCISNACAQNSNAGATTPNARNVWSGTSRFNSTETFRELSFKNPWIGISVDDASPNSTDPMTQGESYALPVVSVRVKATGSGVPVPGYFYVSNASPSANNAQDASNSIGVFGGCESNGAAGDRHSGCWGANFIAASDGPGSGIDQSLFGAEVNIFVNRADPGRFSRNPSSRAKFGIVSTSSGTFHPQAGFQVSQSNGEANAFYDGYSCDRAIDNCYIAGTRGAISHTKYGYRASARGAATAGTNYPSLPLAFFGSTWNGSAAQDDIWQWENEPATGANPATLLALRHSVNGAEPANVFSVSSNGAASLNGHAVGTTLNSGSGLYETKRDAAGCATSGPAGAVCTSTITWTAAFPDTAYSVHCQGNGVGSGTPVIGALTSKSAAGVVVQTVAITAAAAQFKSIECAAIHD